MLHSPTFMDAGAGAGVPVPPPSISIRKMDSRPVESRTHELIMQLVESLSHDQRMQIAFDILQPLAEKP